MINPFKKKYLQRSNRYKGRSEMSVEINGVNYAIHNISRSGILLKGDSRKFRIQDELSGIFIVKKKRVEVGMMVVRLEVEKIAVRITANQNDYEKLIFGIFKLEELGKQASYIGADKLKENEHGIPHWYQSMDNSEVFYTENNGEVNYFQISLYGQYIEFRADKDELYVGKLEEGTSSPLEYKKSELIHREKDDEKIKRLIMDALEFIIFIDFKSSQHYNFIRETLTKSL